MGKRIITDPLDADSNNKCNTCWVLVWIRWVAKTRDSPMCAMGCIPQGSQRAGSP